MRIRTLLIAFSMTATALAASPERFEAIQLVRSIILHPDSWSDLSDESARIESTAENLTTREAEASRRFLKSLQSYSEYFADYPFEMGSESRRALAVAIHDYEVRFYFLFRESRAAHEEATDGFHGCLDAATIARSNAAFSLDALGPIFAPYCTKPNRPNELAAIVIRVVDAYGEFLASLVTEMPNQPPETRPTSRPVSA